MKFLFALTIILVFSLALLAGDVEEWPVLTPSKDHIDFRKLGVTLELSQNLFTSSNFTTDSVFLKLGFTGHLFRKRDPSEKNGFNFTMWFADTGNAGYSRKTKINDQLAITYDYNIAVLSIDRKQYINAIEFGPMFRINIDPLAEDGFPKGFGLAFYLIVVPGLSQYYNPVNGTQIGSSIKYSL